MITLSNDDILKLADPGRMISQMEQAFLHADQMPQRLHCDLPGTDGATLLVMPAWQKRDAIGVKVATIMPDNNRRGLPTIDGLYVLLDGATGIPMAVMGAAALTALRTAAVSGLAARHLARADAATLLMIGTGALAPHLIRAHATVKAFEKILVWGRDAAKAASVIRQVEGISARLEATEDLAAALARADVICAATSAAAPLVQGALLKLGTHVDLIGSFAPDMREADSAVFRRGRLVVDTADGFHKSGDLLAPAAEGIITAAATPTLQDLIREPGLRRKDAREITIFKAVGTGLADIAAARCLYDGLQGDGERHKGDNASLPS